MFRIVLLTATIAVAAFPTAVSAACNFCHSKDPKMVHMHSAQGFKDCVTCHGPTAKPTDRNKQSEDTRCMPCHKK